MPKQKVIRSGHSLAVTVPARFAQTIGIKAGQDVQVEVFPEQGQIVYTFSSSKQLPLSEKFIKKRHPKSHLGGDIGSHLRKK